MLQGLKNKKEMNGILLSLVLAAAVALAILLPFLLVDRGFFKYCGDFNSQQIPFYQYVNQFIKTGGGTWSWATDLGSSAVNSYSFYNLGSPFFWLAEVFPARALPWLMVPMFALKFGAIAASACLYLSRYAKTRNMAVVCSIAYAFCGFNVYNTFFNHMLDPVAIFPLLLWALDGFVYDGKRGWFAFFVGLSLVDSYFFFIGNAVFAAIYFLIKLAFGAYKLNLKQFGMLVFEAVLGAGLGMVLALPSFFNLIDNPRTDNFSNGLNLVVFWNQQQIPAIISSIFLPPDPPYMPNIFTEGGIKWTSMSLFLPVISVAGVAAYVKSRKWNATVCLLLVMFFMAVIPILNSSFYAFNASYYARWYYMPLLIMCFATLRALEDENIDLAFGAKFSLVATGAYVIIGLLPTKVDDAWKLGAAQNIPKFWLTFGTALLGAALFYALVRLARGRVKLAPMLLGAVMGFSVFYSVIHISLGKFPQWEGDKNYKSQLYDGSAQLSLPDGQFYRIDAYNTYDNLGLWLNKSCLQTFNSVVTPSIMEFYPSVGVKRDVSSKPETKFFALRGLLSVKYTVMPLDQRETFTADPVASGGWALWKEEGPFAVFENTNFVPLGFTYDYYTPTETFDVIPEEARSPMLMRAIGLDANQRHQYSHLFSGELPESEWASADYGRYVLDCSERRAEASHSVTADAGGFVSNITLHKDNLVFYAVPYDPGFTATVNGADTEILKVSNGLMAVYAPAGENEIVFTYRTPGFHTGIAITVLSLAVLGAYVAAVQLKRRGKLRLPGGNGKPAV